MFDLSTTLWDKISADVMLKIVAGLCSGALLWPANKLWHTISPLFLKPFSITGIWIGVCKTPSYEAIEVYRIVVRKERVVFSFFSFLPNSTSVRRFVGSGILRGKFLSAFYYSPQAQSQVSGVLSFQMVGTGDRLVGAYTQYTKDDSLLPDRMEFDLTRIPVSWFRQLRMIFWRKPFQTYQKAREFLPAVRGNQASGRGSSIGQRQPTVRA
jgi:hypothetical protein